MQISQTSKLSRIYDTNSDYNGITNSEYGHKNWLALYPHQLRHAAAARIIVAPMPPPGYDKQTTHIWEKSRALY